jgi:Bucentaur or craniofacial development
MDKTENDWKGYTDANDAVAEELHTHKKSADTYLGKQAFLKQAELTEYERQRNSRLQSDIRTRARA